MKSIKNMINIQSSIDKIFKDLNISDKINSILIDINRFNGYAFLVGGTVRDIVLNIPNKDIDIEIHNIRLKELEDILNKYGNIYTVGKSFGVLRLEGLDVDWSLPRYDKSGRKPEVVINHNMGIENALKRRDLTMNAMAINLHNYKFIDPFNGLQDINDKILRTPDESFFIEDPLRFYRVMQFIGRFDMEPDKTLNNICQSMDINNISKERIEQEFNKLLLKSVYPSYGIRWLKKIKRLKEILPELYNTINIKQEYKWHPEGDVFEHSMQALDAAAQYCYKSIREKLMILYTALVHDLGKVTTTRTINGKIHSYRHEIVGVELSKKMLNRILTNKKIIKPISILVRFHMQARALVKLKSSPAAYKRLAYRLNKADVTMRELSLLSYADTQGRNGDIKSKKPLSQKVEILDTFIRKAKELGIYEHPLKPLILGRDLTELIKPGPSLGELVKYAYNVQIEKNIHDKDELKKIVKKYIKSNNIK